MQTKKNLEIARKRKFKCLGCGKGPTDVLFNYKTSGRFCITCYEAVEFTVKLGLFIITPTMLAYWLSRMI